MTGKSSTLESLLWLTPIANDFLRCVSKVLRGNVPCPTKELADLLSKTEDCEGLLGIESFRKAVAAEIANIGGDVSDSAAPALVGALGKALEKEIGAIKKSAGGVNVKQLQKKGGPMPSFSAALPLQPKKGQSQALSKDWIVWHALANAHDEKLVSAPPDTVVAGRIAVAACCPDGPVGDCALSLDILENIDAYIKWELSLAGSKTPTNKIEVLVPFDDKTGIEVAMRRMLSTALPPETALQVIAEAKGDAGRVSAAMKKLTESTRSQSLIPMYAAPPAPKEPKAPKQPKEPKETKDKSGKKEENSQSKPTSESVVSTRACPSGPFGEMHAATAGQELQWHLLSYCLNPGTALSRGMGNASQANGSQKTQSSEPLAAVQPNGFAGIWGGRSPPGHTSFSWNSSVNCASNSFHDIWSTSTGVLPPGHTSSSWASGSCAVATTSTSSTAQAKKDPAPTNQPKAKPEPTPKKESKKESAPKKEAAPKKDAKKAKDEPGVEEPVDRAKWLKKVIKEGGKRGVEIEGSADMGGLQFFCTSVAEPDGDLEMLQESLKAMNAKSDPADEERKGGSGHIGKMIFSAGTKQLAVVAYVPEEKHGELVSEDWLKAVLALFQGEVVSTSKAMSSGKVDANSDKAIFPLKIREPMILEANNFLRKKGLFPEDKDSDGSDLVFGDDDFPS